ncbi:polyvinyl alcohol dehydrogenase (cytochrome) [Actinoallomurus bryophytorum]|uniref:Polyvinyl alcohol dehydrogenase (Cytochrome) n=1 Tax=Actinoallomurus bryophytorum TaxID=1490222 RepID=A0A543CUQ9_9ACTN|nr:polyvinyl alcohol dehydrogenase (cytochrome) [Actinoallomurus bryophytorum]
MVTRWKIVIAAMTAGLTVASCGTAVTRNVAMTSHDDADRGSAASWRMWQGDLQGSRYNPSERKITPATVGKLKLKWAFTYAKLPFSRTGSQPAVVDGVLYVGAPDAKFYALDAKTGARKWVFDLTPVAGPVSDSNLNMVRDGAAVEGDKVYFGDGRGYVYALNKKTGRLIWARRPEPNTSAWLTSSPLVYHGRVYIGISSTEAGTAGDPNYACCRFRGSMVALDGRTGALDWRHYVMPPATKVGTWPSGADMYAPSGGAVWSSPAVDPRTGTLYVGTGQNYTGETGEIDSVLALNSRTGALRWKQQMAFPDTYTMACITPNPSDYCPSHGRGTALDNDFGASPNIIRVGHRTIVAIGQKGGIFHAFDAASGKILWQTQLSVMDPDKPDPGDVGVQWGSSFDGKRLYAATWRANPGMLYALDPATGHILWKTPAPEDGCTTGGAAASPDMCLRAFTPAVSSTPGLIYEGSYSGKMYIFSSANGKLLWQFDAVQDFQGVNGIPGRGIGISGNGGAVIVDGMMYVQAGYYPYYPSDKGYTLLAFGL